MANSPTPAPAEPESWPDERIVARILAGEIDLFAIIMRRYNTRLYRAAFSILGDEDEAEDVMEDTYVRAYQHLEQFAGRAKFSTWLTRIAINEALMRKRRGWRQESLDDTDGDQGEHEPVSSMPDPEQVLSQKELATYLERSILALPENYRVMLVLRDINELSVAETAECLGLSEENVRIRLYRARAALRRKLYAGRAKDVRNAFTFSPCRNDWLAVPVLARVRLLELVPALRA